jgi:hypothetical protein
LALDLSRAHEVHGSVIKSFQGCRLRHHWEFEEGWSPLQTPAPLEFGGAFHRAMEVLYNPETWHLPLVDLYRRAKAVFIEVCLEQKARYLELVGQYVLDREQEVDYEARIELGCGMLRKVARSMDRKNFTPILVEQEAFVPVLDPITRQVLHCKCSDCWNKIDWDNEEENPNGWSGLPVLYGIRIDAALKDKDGGFWIVDWKTAAQLLKDQTVLELDGQIGTYSWVLADQMGLDFRGFYYVQIYKGFPRIPKRLAVSRLGRQFSISRSQRTDYTTAKKTFEKLDPEAYKEGLYSEYLDWLNDEGPKFIKWFKVYKTPHQLGVIGQDLALAIRDMIDPHDIYPNPGRHCQWCPFQLPCLERQSGDATAILESQFEKLPLYYIVERERRKKVDA